MVTPEEVAGVTVFAELDPAAQERLARAAADISLPAGEYAAHEGDGRALFAVLEGKIEPVKAVDGVGGSSGERLPSEIFGEAPIALGTVFPVGFRAAENSRLMRLTPHDYHAVASVRCGSMKRVAAAVGDGSMAIAFVHQYLEDAAAVAA